MPKLTMLAIFVILLITYGSAFKLRMRTEQKRNDEIEGGMCMHSLLQSLIIHVLRRKNLPFFALLPFSEENLLKFIDLMNN